ncbi:MAG: TAXI family TRAP transporter solute-binding subunit [Betaproteobacteria bacterium]|nr:TAXI family TRAP transporter solute-binding subunit [Betaproteobacteria bacterium]
MMRMLIRCLALAMWLAGSYAYAAAAFKIVTADQRGTYFAIGNDLAKLVAPSADIDLEVVATDGSAANIRLLREAPGVKFAIVQADVYQAFVDRGAQKNREAMRVIAPLRVILPLYNTEIHYIARADSELNYLHDLKNARINGGLVGSGAAFITHTLYRMMFKTPMPEQNASFLPNDQALVKLITDKSIDVAVVAAGQPAPIIANMKPEAQKFIKFLKFDPSHPTSKQPLSIYVPSVVRASSYPNILTEDFTTIAVGAFLVTYDYNLQTTVDYLVRFARSLCQNFSALQAKGHPKWREVSLALPALNKGWTYYPPTTRELRQCTGGGATSPSTPRACTSEERILGFCK